MARELGRQGARITLAARDKDELERARADLASRGIDAFSEQCDVTNRDDAERLIAGTVERTGRIDVFDKQFKRIYRKWKSQGLV